jgi:hypothetical protein
MLLIRVVGLQTEPAPDSFEDFSVELGDVRVSSLGSQEREGGLYVVLAGEIELSYPPKRTGDGDLVVPDRERRLIEEAIEASADVVAVAYNLTRQLSSPNPYVAFKAQTEDDRALLDSARGIHDLRGRARSSVAIHLRLNQELLDQLRDRLDGVSLLAEARSTGHLTGRFHEFVRFFERAFARPASLLAPLLVQFLHPHFGYTEAELTNWFDTLRNPATHADARPTFVLEGDVRPVIARMEQAAFDVLMNKEHWRDQTVDRRAVWFPSGGTTNADNAVYMVKSTTGRLVSQLTDQWEVYPLDLEAQVRTPAEWWPGPMETLLTAEHPVEVIEPPAGVQISEGPAPQASS